MTDTIKTALEAAHHAIDCLPPSVVFDEAPPYDKYFALLKQIDAAIAALSAQGEKPVAAERCRSLIKQIDDALHERDSDAGHRLLHDLAFEFEKIAARECTTLQAAPSFEIKPLEWKESNGQLDGQKVWSAGDPWVFWIVKNPPGSDYIWCENFNIEGWFPVSPVRGSFSTLDEAKAAAQADYEQRIRSALRALAAGGRKPPYSYEHNGPIAAPSDAPAAGESGVEHALLASGTVVDDVAGENDGAVLDIIDDMVAAWLDEPDDDDATEREYEAAFRQDCQRLVDAAQQPAPSAERMREALEKIIEGAPTEEPEPNGDAYGYFSDDPDDHHERGYEVARFQMAEIAREALTAPSGATKSGPTAEEAEQAFGALPLVSMREGLASRTGLPTPKSDGAYPCPVCDAPGPSDPIPDREALAAFFLARDRDRINPMPFLPWARAHLECDINDPACIDALISADAILSLLRGGGA